MSYDQTCPCGARNAANRETCHACGASLIPGGQDLPVATATSRAAPASASAPAPTAATSPTAGGSMELCLLLGTVSLCIGLYLLVLDPGTEMDGIQTVVNLQKLYVGQTLSIIGGLFLTAALRPR